MRSLPAQDALPVFGSAQVEVRSDHALDEDVVELCKPSEPLEENGKVVRLDCRKIEAEVELSVTCSSVKHDVAEQVPEGWELYVFTSLRNLPFDLCTVNELIPLEGLKLY